MARLSLFVRAYFFRALQSIFTTLDTHFSHPIPSQHAFARKIPSTVSSYPGFINLLFYTPSTYSHSNTAKNGNARKLHPILVNFHGGGFTIGNAQDDARWAGAVTKGSDTVVVSVDYRRAPEFLFPTGIEDCLTAVLWLWGHAEELGLDATRTAFSGFSAGGNFTYAVAIRLYEEIIKLEKEGQHVKGNLTALVSFYPSVDWTKTRAERDAMNPNVIPVIPPVLYKLFNAAYLHSTPINMANPLLSPAQASDELLRDALPREMVLITCWGVSLLVEAEAFRQRLKGLGKRVEGYTVDGVDHGWDKKPTYKKGSENREKAYEASVGWLKEFWNERRET